MAVSKPAVAVAPAAAPPRKPVVPKAVFLTADAPKLMSTDPRLATYSRKTHKAVKPSDFISKAEALRYQAGLCESTAMRIRKDADLLEKMGSIVDNKKAKRLLAISKQMEALKASLTSDGLDVGALLASMGITMPQ